MRTLFWLLGAALPMLAHAAPTEHNLVSITSNKAEGTLQVKVLVDDDFKITAFKFYKANDAEGTVFATASGVDSGFYLPGLPREDLVHVRTTKNTPAFDPASGGRLTVTFFTNYVLKQVDYRFYELVRAGQEWTLYVVDQKGRRPFTRMRVLGGLVGISRIIEQ